MFYYLNKNYRIKLSFNIIIHNFKNIELLFEDWINKSFKYYLNYYNNSFTLNLKI